MLKMPHWEEEVGVEALVIEAYSSLEQWTVCVADETYGCAIVEGRR